MVVEKGLATRVLRCAGSLFRNRTLMDILLAKLRVGGKLCVHVHAHRRPQPTTSRPAEYAISTSP